MARFSQVSTKSLYGFDFDSRVQAGENIIMQIFLFYLAASEPESAKGHWFHISDTHVQAVPVSKVLNSQAYLLFYERVL